MSGRVRVDGSSTVAPISMAAAEMFRKDAPRVQVTVGTSGTGGGFKKFLEASPSLRTDISDASRPIKDEELALSQQLGVEFIELPVAFDGIAVVVNPKNTFCEHLTLAELKRIWEPGSKVNNWNQVRDGFPSLAIKLYGPGPDSGTFDYFTEAVNGKDRACRADYTPSENDNVLVQGVEGDPGALGYFGFAYYEANKAKLRLVAIDAGDGKPITPSIETIRDGSYSPLSRPLFLYVNRASAERPEVAAFVEFVLKNGKKIVEHPRVNYVALPDDLYALVQERFKGRVAGTMFPDHHSRGKNLRELLKAQR